MLKTTEPMELPFFNENQIQLQVEKVIKFLEMIHPFLKEDSYQEGCIELRPIKRGKVFTHVRSFNAWRLMKNDKQKLVEFFQRVNGQGYCIYYSVFNFNYEKEVTNSKGKKKRAGKINNENALSTQILVMDFDDISLEDFKLEKQKLIDLGIETIDIFSGHGYQSIILLKEKVYDKQILKKFTKLLIQKGFKVDAAIVDPARVMRVPFTFNCKSLDGNNKYHNTKEELVIPVGVDCSTERRYYVADIFKKINSLIDVMPSYDNQETLDLKVDVTLKHTSSKEETQNELVLHAQRFKNDTSEIGEKLYPMLPFLQLPKAIQNMLLGARLSFRNLTGYYLTSFFANTLGYSIDKVKEIMIIWGTQCTPAWEESFTKLEVERFYHYKNFKSDKDAFSKLANEYGFIDTKTYEKERNLLIPNLLYDNYEALSDASVKIYFTLYLAQVLQKQENYTLEEIEAICGLSRSTVIKNIPTLVKFKLLSKKNGNSRLGEKDIYYPTPYFEKSAGFTLISLELAQWLKDKATSSELKVYLLMRHMVGPMGGTCTPSQKYLAKKLGKRDQSAISKLTTRMHEKNLIKKTTEKYQNVPHTSYSLTNEINMVTQNDDIRKGVFFETAS